MELGGGMEIATKPRFKACRLEIEDVYGRLDLVCNVTKNK
jgi:hypothetical protein